MEKKKNEGKKNGEKNKYSGIPKGAGVAIAAIGMCEVLYMVVISIFIIKNEIPVEVYVKMAEGSLLSTGLAIIGVAISVWTGLNIANAIEKREVDNIKNTLEKTESIVEELDKSTGRIKKQVECDKDDIAKIEKERETIYFGSFMYELLKTDQDIMSNYLYKCFDKKPFEIKNEYVNLIVIEQYFNQVYLINGGRNTVNNLVKMKIEKALEMIGDMQGNIKKTHMELNETLSIYLAFRKVELKFLKGYFLKEVELYDAFVEAADGFKEISKKIGIKLPEYGEKNKDDNMCYGGKEELLELAIYFMNSIGESYSKIIFEKNIMGKYSEKNVRITREKLEEYADKAIFYLEIAAKWAECLEPNEVYYRNLGCAYERTDVLRETFGENSDKILLNYKKAFNINISNEQVSKIRIQKVYHTLLSYYERYIKNYFGYYFNAEQTFNTVDEVKRLVDCTKYKFNDKCRNYLIEYQEISSLAVQDNARFLRQRVLNGLSLTWIILLLLCNDNNVKSRYSKGVEFYLKEVEVIMGDLEVMGATDNWYVCDLKKRYSALTEYLNKYSIT